WRPVRRGSVGYAGRRPNGAGPTLLVRAPGQVRRLGGPHMAPALPQRPLVPADPEPLEIGDDRLEAALDVPRRIRVVDPQQQPALALVGKAAVRDRAERVAEVQRARRARREAHVDHRASLGLSSARDGILARNSSPPKRLVRRFPPQRPREAAGRDAFRPDNTEVYVATPGPGGAPVQLVEIPGLIEGASEDRGGGRALLGVLRNADAILYCHACDRPLDELETIRDEVAAAGIELPALVAATKCDEAP